MNPARCPRDIFIPEILYHAFIKAEWEKRSCDAIRVTFAVSTHTPHGESNEALKSQVGGIVLTFTLELDKMSRPSKFRG